MTVSKINEYQRIDTEKIPNNSRLFSFVIGPEIAPQTSTNCLFAVMHVTIFARLYACIFTLSENLYNLAQIPAICNSISNVHHREVFDLIQIFGKLNAWYKFTLGHQNVKLIKFLISITLNFINNPATGMTNCIFFYLLQI